MPMYDLTEHRLNYSQNNKRFMVYSKDEATNFNADIGHNNN